MSDTPRTDANEIDLHECISVQTFSNGSKAYVQKYVPAYIARELELELAGLRMDAERIAFAESKRATIYAAYDNGRVLHWVFVDETKPNDRRGVLGKSVRAAIDAAMQPLSPPNEKG